MVLGGCRSFLLLVTTGFLPGFSYRATYHRCIFCRFFPASCYANFFTYVTASALYIYTFPVDRCISIYVFQAIVNNIRTCALMFMYCQYGFTSSFTVKTILVNKTLVLSVRRYHARVTHQIMLGLL